MASKPRLDVTYADVLEFALTAPGNIGDTYTRFYNYSFGNVMLLMMQGVDSPVANFKTWQKMGRKPLPGTGKTVWAPRMVTRTNDDGTKSQICVGFIPRNGAFQYTDTEGEEIELPQVINDWNLDQALTQLKVSITQFDMPLGNVQGFSTPNREIAINPMAVYPQKTIIHELGHIMCGHFEKDKEMNHRGMQEFQAEAVAYLVMNELGGEWNPDSSRAYIQNWLKGEKPDEKAISKVFGAVNQILRAGR